MSKSQLGWKIWEGSSGTGSWGNPTAGWTIGASVNTGYTLVIQIFEKNWLWINSIGYKTYIWALTWTQQIYDFWKLTGLTELICAILFSSDFESIGLNYSINICGRRVWNFLSLTHEYICVWYCWRVLLLCDIFVLVVNIRGFFSFLPGASPSVIVQYRSRCRSYCKNNREQVNFIRVCQNIAHRQEEKP